MGSHELRRGEGPSSSVSSVLGGKLAVVASHEGLLDRTVILDGDSRTSGWDNLFLLIVMFLLREPPSVVLAVAASLTSTESVVGMTLLLITRLLTAMMVRKGRWKLDWKGSRFY
ncbi:hypothetical protein VFPPC_17777 [Pochonia chlamydosporia 170]|uniref:Uncharacterized protein n=1 Tax=Pochonia chlamydosporia 170 TaxID=1380566 RepID=A0A219AQI7_METCM|nr:hypothetical protein VFPPC_17777 [Pochonia chlamydosporia 170]OWT43047.1 hypothetical protein VFPPC_17777 [Pochonia chlamydosporia 170]